MPAEETPRHGVVSRREVQVGSLLLKHQVEEGVYFGHKVLNAIRALLS